MISYSASNAFIIFWKGDKMTLSSCVLKSRFILSFKIELGHFFSSIKLKKTNLIHPSIIFAAPIFRCKTLKKFIFGIEKLNLEAS